MTVARAYETLGLDGARASADEVRLRFRDLILANHPDRAPLDRQARANEMTRELVEAYTFLRERGYPRAAVRRAGAFVAASEPAYEPQERPEEAAADRFAWVEDVWRESLERGRPEDAVTRAIFRAAWSSLGALAFLVLGALVLVAAVFAGAWILVALGAVWLVFGVRFAAGARRIVGDVIRFWKAWARVADRAAIVRARQKLGLRLALALIAAGALAAGIRFL